jgi:glycosyltransferase involved in cell wall biosynthesis
MQFLFTVAICTYNGENRLSQLLDSLLLIDFIDSDRPNWEVIVIDNNSTDKTQEILQEYQQKLSLKVQFKYFFESRQGVAFARRRAMKEATSPIVGFLDDDNLPRRDWVINAYNFFDKNPQIGACGSLVRANYEVNPPQNFQRIAPFLAIVERGEKPLLSNSVLPPGAGLVIRKKAWLENVPEEPVLLGRVSNSLLSKGEEIEALCYIQKAGWEIWYNPEMMIYHDIPSSRLQEEYLLKLLAGVGLSRYHTRTIAVKKWQKPFLLFAYLVNDLRKLIWHIARYSAIFPQDIVAACEFKLMLKSFISPFYFLWFYRRLSVHQ